MRKSGTENWILEIFRTKAGVFGNTCQHAGADFLAIMKRKNEVGPTLSTHGTV
jgi:hypothetical protein